MDNFDRKLEGAAGESEKENIENEREWNLIDGPVILY